MVCQIPGIDCHFIDLFLFVCSNGYRIYWINVFGVRPEVVVRYIETKYHNKYGSNPCVEAKHEEISVVEMPDAVVKPRTVMIHLEDTPEE